MRFLRTIIVYTTIVGAGNCLREIRLAKAAIIRCLNRLLRCTILACLGLSLACTNQKPGTEWVSPDNIRPQASRQSFLTEHQLTRIRQLQSTLSEVDPSSFEKWKEDFEKDQNPEKEIGIWEAIAAAYQTYCSAKTELSLQAKQEVLNILLARPEPTTRRRYWVT